MSVFCGMQSAMLLMAFVYPSVHQVVVLCLKQMLISLNITVW